MLLKAINAIVTGDDDFNPGCIFQEENMVQARRLIELGAAVPVRKTVTLSFSSKTASDDWAKNLMDDKRQSDSNKTVIDADCQKVSMTSSASVSEDDNQQGIDMGGGVLNSLDTRVRAESGHVVNHLDGQPVFAPNHGESVAKAVHRISSETGLSQSEVEHRVQAEIENQ